MLKVEPRVIIVLYELKQNYHNIDDVKQIIKDKLSFVETLSEKEQYAENKIIKKLTKIITNIDAKDIEL